MKNVLFAISLHFSLSLPLSLSHFPSPSFSVSFSLFVFLDLSVSQCLSVSLEGTVLGNSWENLASGGTRQLLFRVIVTPRRGSGAFILTERKESTCLVWQVGFETWPRVEMWMQKPNFTGPSVSVRALEHH